MRFSKVSFKVSFNDSFKARFKPFARLGRLLPAQPCLGCGCCSDTPMALCRDCQNNLPINGTQCRCCGLPMVAPGLCGRCIRVVPSYSRIYSPYLYDYPVDHLIKQFKQHGNFAAGQVLLQLMMDYLQPGGSVGGSVSGFVGSQALVGPVAIPDAIVPDVIMPIPLHWRRLWQRGFNQAAWLAKRLGDHLNCLVDSHNLRRVRYAMPQQHLPRKRRLTNLAGVFQCDTRLDGLHIALVDDVVTTGATVEAASACLLAAGANKVDVWCVARTPMVR